jgi:hypothetical protein
VGVPTICRKERVQEVPKNIPQGVKAIHFVRRVGTTEVVPFQSFDSTVISALC